MIRSREIEKNMTLIEQNNPTISVIVPIYGVEKYLNQCIQSIVFQNYKNLEIILVDDGSQDQCPAMCDEWGKVDPRIIVIHKSNGGLSDARNAGLKQATGEYITFIDSDDWIDRRFIECLFTALLESNADVAECSVLYVDDAGSELKVRYAESKKRVLDRMTALKCLLKGEGVSQTVWNKLYKTSILNNLWFEVGKYNEDEFWTYKVLDRIQSMALVQEPLYFYRQRNTSIMGKAYSLRRLDGLLALSERYDYLKKYKDLNSISYEQFLLSSLWGLQMSLRNLNDQDKKYAVKYILSLVRQKNHENVSLRNTKSKFWIIMFIKFPVLTAKLRNFLGIGV